LYAISVRALSGINFLSKTVKKDAVSMPTKARKKRAGNQAHAKESEKHEVKYDREAPARKSGAEKNSPT
jgi:hypothetical protein